MLLKLVWVGTETLQPKVIHFKTGQQMQGSDPYKIYSSSSTLFIFDNKSYAPLITIFAFLSNPFGNITSV